MPVAAVAVVPVVRAVAAPIPHGRAATAPPPPKRHKVGPALRVYEVERLLDHMQSASGSKYLVRWSGYDDKSDSWESERNILDKSLIACFWRQRETERMS